MPCGSEAKKNSIWRGTNKPMTVPPLKAVNMAFIVIGLFVIYHVFKLMNILPASYISYMFSMNAIICICGIVGVMATFKEDILLIKVYCAIVIVAIIVQVIGIYLFKQFDDLIIDNARKHVEKQWNEEVEHPGSMDDLQKQFKCCGNNSYNDYINILHRPEVPSSCSVISNITEGCFTGAEHGITKSYAYTLRPNPSSVLISCILVPYAIYLVTHFRNKINRRQRENFAT